MEDETETKLPMHNLSVKFSALAGKYGELTPQDFLDLSPEASLVLYKGLLPRRVRYTLEFGLSNAAILEILEHDFRVDMGTLELVCTGHRYDPAIWLHAFGLTRLPDDPALTRKIDEDFAALWPVVSGNLKPELQEEKAIKAEFQTILGLYHMLYGPMLRSQKPQTAVRGHLAMLRAMVIQTIHKSDAAQVLFGASSAYTRLWVEKQQMLLDCIQLFTTRRTKLSA